MFKLPEQLVIQHIDDLHQQILEYLKTEEVIVIDGSDVIKMDTSGIQLLCSIQKGLQSVGQKIHWREPGEVLKSTARMTGVSDFLDLSVTNE